jgi:peptidoglycan/LPS O-acetylase OafA/YrhL
MRDVAICLQAFVASSIFFVWVVRYDNIIQEFKHYQLPDWLRDIVGILKLTFALLLVIGVEHGEFAVFGGTGIALLMAAAFVTHLRVKSPIFKMVPSTTLLVLSVMIAVLNYRLLQGP